MMQRRHLLLAAALIGTLWLSVGMDGRKKEDDSIVAPTKFDGRSSTRVAAASQRGERMILEIKKREAGPAIENAFDRRSWAPPPKAIPAAEAPEPVAPPMPFSYVGKEERAGVWRVFLSRKDDTFIVSEQDTIEDLYKVESIAPPTMVFVYLPLKVRQELAIGDSE